MGTTLQPGHWFASYYGNHFRAVMLLSDRTHTQVTHHHLCRSLADCNSLCDTLNGDDDASMMLGFTQSAIDQGEADEIMEHFLQLH